MSGRGTAESCTVTVAREEVDEPMIDVVGYGAHFVEQSGMSNGIKGLTEVQYDDHYIRVAREQFRNRLENGNYNSCSRGSSWTESILICANKLDGRLGNC